MAAGFKTATVNASDVPATQTDFPAYVDLSRLGITTLAEAQSVRVYADSGKTTEWAREIVSATEMHVKIPSLTSTTAIYVDWDGVRSDYAVTDTYGRNAVWSDYKFVLHMNNTSGTDSTGSYTPTVTGTTQVTGAPFGTNWLEFNGTSDKIDITGSGNSFNNATEASLQGWFNLDDTADTKPLVSNRTVSGGWAEINIASTTHYGDVKTSAGTEKFVLDTVSASTNYMSHFVWTSGGTVQLYRNGSSIGTATPTGTFTNTTAWQVGYRSAVGGWMDGKIREIRGRLSRLSTSWVNTEYNNQSDEAGFWGTWTDAGGGGGGYVFVPQIRPFVGL